MRPMILIFAIPFLMCACSDLRTDYPIQPVRDYEKMIVGRFDADYIGNSQCLAACHKHEKIAKDFDDSVHGEQLDAASGLPLVNCESCHGPGSLSIVNAAKTGKCDTSTFLQFETLPSQAQSLICIKCHTVSSTPVLHNWNGSIHASSDVSCMACHKLHQGPQQKVSRREMAELCWGCHENVRAEFSQFSHHPVQEHKMVCTDCHDPHGSTLEHNLLGTTVKEMCTRCHMEFQGPFVFEHADVTEDCTNCHNAHGSPNNPLLNAAQPFLCMQCHAGHLDSHHEGLANQNAKRGFYGACTDCHSAIHGTDIPSSKGKGSFIAR